MTNVRAQEQNTDEVIGKWVRMTEKYFVWFMRLERHFCYYLFYFIQTDEHE